MTYTSISQLFYSQFFGNISGCFEKDSEKNRNHSDMEGVILLGHFQACVRLRSKPKINLDWFVSGEGRGGIDRGGEQLDEWCVVSTVHSDDGLVG